MTVDLTAPASIEAALRRLDGSAGDPNQKPEDATLFQLAAGMIRALAAKLGVTIE